MIRAAPTIASSLKCFPYGQILKPLFLGYLFWRSSDLQNPTYVMLQLFIEASQSTQAITSRWRLSLLLQLAIDCLWRWTGPEQFFWRWSKGHNHQNDRFCTFHFQRFPKRSAVCRYWRRLPSRRGQSSPNADPILATTKLLFFSIRHVNG